MSDIPGIRSLGGGVRGANCACAAVGISMPEGIRHLEDLSIHRAAPNTAGDRVDRGENVQVVARELGITTTEGVRSLERISIASYHSRRPWIRGHESVQVIAQRRGITTREGLQLLEGSSIIRRSSASAWSGRHESVQDVAREFGITTREGIRLLELVARGPGR